MVFCQPGFNVHLMSAGVMQIPQEALRKKNVLIVRGRFRCVVIWLWLLELVQTIARIALAPYCSNRRVDRMLTDAVRRPFTLLHNDMLQGAAGQFFCEDEDTSATSSGVEDDECVFRDDTLVLLEMTTRDMMEVRDCHSHGLACHSI